MRTLFHRVAISAGIASIAGACALAQAATHHVTAVFTGRSCQVSLDSMDVTVHGPSADFATEPGFTMIGVPGLAPGHTAKPIVCGDLHMMFEGPRDSLPARGIYRVIKPENAAPPPGTVTVRLLGNYRNVARPERLWPVGLLDQDVDGVSGTVRLDRVTKDSLFGRVEIVARSHVKGP